MNKNTTRIALSLIATPVLLGTLAACSSGGDATSADAPEVADSQAPDETQAPAETAAPESSAAPSDDSSQGQAASGVDYTAAITAAQDEVGSGSFAVSLDLDDDGDDRFDIEVALDGVVYEVKVSADGTARIEEQDDDELSRLDEVNVSMEQAIALAQEHQSGVVDSIDLDSDDGSLHWDVDFDDDDGNEQPDLEIDAATGDIRED